jgi:hypothetical protein
MRVVPPPHLGQPFREGNHPRHLPGLSRRPTAEAAMTWIAGGFLILLVVWVVWELGQPKGPHDDG